MTDHKATESSPVEAEYEGFWSRLCCGSCGNVFELEGDVSPNEEVECDLCHTKQIVVGR